jgi:hypothetical protein
MANGFCTIESSIPAIDLEHGILDADLGRIIDIQHDPIVGVDGIRTLLEKHYQSIMGPYSAITTMAKDRKYHIENRWTMKRVDTMSAAHEERGAGAPGGGASTAKPSREVTLRDASQRDHQYLEQGRFERMLGMLYPRRGKWVGNYMALVMRETRERFAGWGTVRRVDGNTGGGKEKAIGGGLLASESDAEVVDRDREELIMAERRLMEELLVYEVERWEEQLWETMKHFIGDSPEKQRLTRGWRGNCWKRLNANICAMDARMDAAKPKANSNEVMDVSWTWQKMREDIQQAWQTVVERFMERETSASMPLQFLESRIREITEPRLWWQFENVERSNQQCEEIASRLKRELEDVEFRLDQGLEHCDQFWIDSRLLQCRHTLSKTLTLLKLRSLNIAPLEAYSRALKQNKTTTHIIFFDNFDSDDDRRWIADTVRDLPWVTSIWVPDRELLPAIDRTAPLFIADYNQDIKPFLENDPQLAHSQGTFVFIIEHTVAVSFVGPTSGNLILRLTHRSATGSNATLKVEGTPFQLSLSSSLTVDDITLHARPFESEKPSFERGVRNNLNIEVPESGYCAYDIQLLDRRGNRYDPASQSPEGVSTTRCVLLSIMVDPLQPLIHHDLLQALIQCRDH